MRSRIKKVTVLIASLAALALGGSAIVQASGGHSNSVSASGVETRQAGDPADKGQANEQTNAGGSDQQDAGQADTDNVQSGDQTTPDNNAGNGSGESGSEVSGNDGPGGHADEPGNPSADHQFQGNE